MRAAYLAAAPFRSALSRHLQLRRRSTERSALGQSGLCSTSHKLRPVAAGALALLGLATSLPAVAGTQSGVIRYSSADQTYGADGVVTISIAGAAAANKATCATELRWALNLTNSKVSGQYIYALILTAMSNGWQVTVTGTGQCSTVSTIEDIAYIEVTKF